MTRRTLLLTLPLVGCVDKAQEQEKPKWEPECPTCFNRDVEQLGDEAIWACEAGHLFVQPKKWRSE
jgi:ribosomal protein L37AE/L43A